MAPEYSNAVVVPAAIAGVGVGATIVALEFGVMTFVAGEGYPPLWMLGAIWAGACIMFMGGFILLGIPAWFVAHHVNRRNWYDALIVGAILAGATYFLWALPTRGSSYGGGGVDYVIDGHYTFAGWKNAIGTAAMVAFGGAAAGLTIWWIVYRNQPISET